MDRDSIIHKPSDTGPIRTIGPVDTEKLTRSLSDFIKKANEGRTQQGLRWAGDFEGIKDLRSAESNPLGYKETDFKNWIAGTEYLQEVAKSFRAPDIGRVRMLMMLPKTTYTLHHDLDGWRLHIPLITHENSLFFVGGKMWHLPIGQAYLVKVSDLHLAINAGYSNRIHVVFDGCASLAF